MYCYLPYCSGSAILLFRYVFTLEVTAGECMFRLPLGSDTYLSYCLLSFFVCLLYGAHTRTTHPSIPFACFTSCFSFLGLCSGGVFLWFQSFVTVHFISDARCAFCIAISDAASMRILICLRALHFLYLFLYFGRSRWILLSFRTRPHSAHPSVTAF